jgi:octaprenyl-diphosphate synthase
MNSKGSIFDRYTGHLARINAELDRGFESRVPLVERIADYSLMAEGKRLRPLLFVLGCEICGYREEDRYHLATIFEYIHTASLLHDDVLDNAQFRRKQDSVNQIWGNQAAVLEGDFLFSKSFSNAVGTGNQRFLRLLAETTIEMAEGQFLELAHTNDWRTTEQDYMDIIRSKTAVLISAACACAAIISGAASAAEKNLADFGLNVGMAFQLMDDLLDYTASAEVFGKPVGKDVREGKITLPLIYTLTDLDAGERERLESRVRSRQAAEKDFQELMAVVRQNGALERVHQKAESYARAAAGALSSLPKSAARQSMLEINQYMIKRNF